MSTVARKQKTTFKVRQSLWELFRKECKAVSLRGDDLLNRTLPGEIAQLEDIPPCDAEGERWLKKTWLEHFHDEKETALRPAPVTLSADVLEYLNAACEKNRVPRDAFVDCALQFLSARLYEPAIVIKNPRTTKDLARQVADVLSQDDGSERDKDRWLIETANKWFSERGMIASMAPDFYRSRLSYDRARVEQEKQMIAALGMLDDIPVKQNTKP
jgi:hypothetical protein